MAMEASSELCPEDSREIITVIILFAVIAGFGLYVVNEIPLEQTLGHRDAHDNCIFILQGSSPEEVEKSVTRILESAL